jgi:predicted O-linked N-acetylglucosamine transferase (SPINDLY family)
MGAGFASRVAASLLQAIGLSELIANDQEKYKTMAISLASNPEKLKQIRKKLAANRLTTPLFNTDLFATHIETAFLRMYEQYHADLPADHLYLTN